MMSAVAMENIPTATMKGATRPKKSADQLAMTPDKMATSPFPQVAQANVSETRDSSKPKKKRQSFGKGRQKWNDAKEENPFCCVRRPSKIQGQRREVRWQFLPKCDQEKGHRSWERAW